MKGGIAMVGRMWTAIVAVSIAGAVCGTAAGAPATAPPVAGSVATGRVSMDVVGQSQQNDASFTSVGYVTHLAGVPDAALFSDPNVRDEAHAHLVFSDSSTVTARSVLGPLFVLDLSGRTTFRWQATPSSSFANPATFAAGSQVGVFRSRVHDVVTVLAPDSGIATAVEELAQTRTGRLPLPRRPRLGKVGMHLRLEATGAARRSSLTPLISTTQFAGVALGTD